MQTIFLARKLLKEFPNKVHIFNTSNKKLLTYLTHRLILLLRN